MDKKFRKNRVWPVMLLAAGLISGGCGKAEPFDASGYVESVLDAIIMESMRNMPDTGIYL